MSAILSSPPAAEFELPDHVWRVDQLASRMEEALSTGLPALDAVLPGGGWPVGQLVEVLQARPQQHVWRLLVPALARAVQAQAGPVVLVVPAPIKRSYIWDLLPEASAVRRLLAAGARVLLAEWQPAPREFGLADYADRLLGACLEAAPSRRSA